MAHKKKHKDPVPRGNQPKAGPGADSSPPPPKGSEADSHAQEHDPKRRLGNFAGTGNHPYQQPGGLNDANH